MIEVWLQVTCNGCGATDNTDLPNTTKGEYRASLHKQYGWKAARGNKDYCRKCVEAGRAAKGVNIFAIGTEKDDSKTGE